MLMNLGVCTSRIRAPRVYLFAAAALLPGLLSLPLVAQSPKAVQEEGRVVWTNDNPSSTEAGTSKEYVYWSNSEQRWRPVRAASPRALRQARAVAGEVSSYIASRPEVDPAESKDPANSKPSADSKDATKAPRRSELAAGDRNYPTN